MDHVVGNDAVAGEQGNDILQGTDAASVFTYRYKKPDGSIEVVAIPHPELALFDISIAKEWDETSSPTCTGGTRTTPMRGWSPR
ncbi:hypothetical protein [Hydrogenophaga electricum]|uniref:hypothetical protein n=1 Tax=Hydrogenophaga electricum TaxID=1230953 RepID=UPI0024E0FE34|nr:hypothetical protein [Hydrogenophaga electricum]